MTCCQVCYSERRPVEKVTARALAGNLIMQTVCDRCRVLIADRIEDGTGQLNMLDLLDDR